MNDSGSVQDGGEESGITGRDEVVGTCRTCPGGGKGDGGGSGGGG